MKIPSGIELRVMDVDEDYSMVEFSAADGAFAGSTQLYSGEQADEALATGVAGFPSRSDEQRDIELGSRDLRIADGWVVIQCRCADRVGHVLLEIEITDKANGVASPGRSVHLRLAAEPAALDRFAAALRGLRWQAGASATHGSAV